MADAHDDEDGDLPRKGLHAALMRLHVRLWVWATKTSSRLADRLSKEEPEPKGYESLMAQGHALRGEVLPPPKPADEPVKEIPAEPPPSKPRGGGGGTTIQDPRPVVLPPVQSLSMKKSVRM